MSKSFEELLKEKRTTSYSGGISTVGLLGVVFVTLKLIGTITWSWWWVLAPFWIPALLAIILLTLLVIIYVSIRKKAGKVLNNVEAEVAKPKTRRSTKKGADNGTNSAKSSK